MDQRDLQDTHRLVLHTKRLLLRPHDSSDIDFMVQLNADHALNRYTGDGPITVEQAHGILRSLQHQLDEHRMGRFMVLSRETGERFGWCGLKWIDQQGVADLGYRILRKHWSRGIATEAARACVDYGFRELSLVRIVAELDEQNVASVHILQKLGFTCLAGAWSLETANPSVR